jgi:hypothetical protein
MSLGQGDGELYLNDPTRNGRLPELSDDEGQYRASGYNHKHLRHDAELRSDVGGYARSITTYAKQHTKTTTHDLHERSMWRASSTASCSRGAMCASVCALLWTASRRPPPWVSCSFAMGASRGSRGGWEGASWVHVPRGATGLVKDVRASRQLVAQQYGVRSTGALDAEFRERPVHGHDGGAPC